MGIVKFLKCLANPKHIAIEGDRFCKTCGSRTRRIPDEEVAECNYCGIFISKGEHCPHCGRNYMEATTTHLRPKRETLKIIASGGAIGGLVMATMIGPMLHAMLSNLLISGIFIWGGMVILVISLLAIMDLYHMGF